MKFVLLAALGASALMTPQVTLAKEPVSLTPSSQWIVDFSEQKCTIARQFGAGDDLAILKISTFLPDWGYDLTLIGRHARLSNWRGGPSGGSIGIEFSPGGPQAEAFLRTAETDRFPALVATGVFEEPTGSPESRHYLTGEPDRYANIERIDFTSGMRDRLTLVTGEMRRVFALMDECKWKQVKHWGLDVDANRHRTSGPTIKPGVLEDIADQLQAKYPAAALRARRIAQISLRLIVDQQGSVSNCTVISGTEAKEFADVPCKPFLSQPHIFEPAHGADGRPIASWAQQTVRYRIP